MQRYKINATEEEVVSNVHKPSENNDQINDSCDMDIGCMHPNENNTLPTGNDAEIMKTFVEIAKKTGQSSEIMNLPPIDHDSPIRYVLSYQSYSHDLQKSNFMYHLTSIHWHSKYDHTKHFFVNSYPWLFPGGVGDIYDLERGEISIKEWGRHLLGYCDRRFLEDPLFGLFLYNAIQRHTNNSEGNFFFKSDEELF